MPPDAHILQQHTMARQLVVEAEAVAGVTGLMDAGRELDEFAAGMHHRTLPLRIVGRVGRILREGMQQIGQ